MLKRIPAAQAILGMYIHKLEGAWIEHGFWKNHFLLERTEDCNACRRRRFKMYGLTRSRGATWPPF